MEGSSNGDGMGSEGGERCSKAGDGSGLLIAANASGLSSLYCNWFDCGRVGFSAYDFPVYNLSLTD